MSTVTGLSHINAWLALQQRSNWRRMPRHSFLPVPLPIDGYDSPVPSLGLIEWVYPLGRPAVAMPVVNTFDYFNFFNSDIFNFS